MPDYQLPDQYNTTGGIDRLFIYANTQEPNFTIYMFAFIWLVILVSGYFATSRRTGDGKFFMWAAIASLITTTGIVTSYLVVGLLNLEFVIIAIAVTIVFVGLYMFTNLGE